jgi:flavodoxin
MPALVIFDSKFGNTRRVAEAVARGVGDLGPVRLVNAAEPADVSAALAEKPDLLLVGGPTQGRHPSPALRAFLGTLPADLGGLRATSFDTRYRGAVLLMGSAAADAGKSLCKAGGQLVAPPESFFIRRAGRLETQELEPGEIERAERWGRSVAAVVPGAQARGEG